MNTTHQIIKAIQCGGYIAYDNYRETCFLKWCIKYANQFNISLRVLQTNDIIRNWYHEQWMLLVERPFVKMYGDQFHKDDAEITSALQELICQFPISIENFYPSGVLTMLKKESYEITSGRYKQMQQS